MAKKKAAKKKTTRKSTKTSSKSKVTKTKAPKKQLSAWDKVHPFNKFMWKVTGVIYVVVVLYILLQV